MSNASLGQQPDQRVALSVKVRISTIDPETDPKTGKPYFRTSEETSANVSRGGTFVQTREPITPGRRLLVEIEIPDGPRIQTLGRVAWTRTAMEPAGDSSDSSDSPNSGFGIEFTGASPEHLSQLQAFLDRTDVPKAPSPEKRWGAPTTRADGA